MEAVWVHLNLPAECVTHLNFSTEPSKMFVYSDWNPLGMEIKTEL